MSSEGRGLQVICGGQLNEGEGKRGIDFYSLYCAYELYSYINTCRYKPANSPVITTFPWTVRSAASPGGPFSATFPSFPSLPPLPFPLHRVAPASWDRYIYSKESHWYRSHGNFSVSPISESEEASNNKYTSREALRAELPASHEIRRPKSEADGKFVRLKFRAAAANSGSSTHEKH